MATTHPFFITFLKQLTTISLFLNDSPNNDIVF